MSEAAVALEVSESHECSECREDSQTEVTGVLTEKVAELQDSVAQNLAKFEMGMDKVLQTVEASSAKPSSQDKRSSRQADRSG